MNEKWRKYLVDRNSKHRIQNKQNKFDIKNIQVGLCIDNQSTVNKIFRFRLN